ncbi:hypothetical protein ACTFIV_001205 [Dictyostelium citrinum]
MNKQSFIFSEKKDGPIQFQIYRYPFINDQPQSNIKSVPFFKSFLNYIDFQYSDTLLNDIILKMNLQSVFDNNHFKYFNHCRDEDKEIVYLIYELPSTFCFRKCDKGLSNVGLNKCEKDKLFFRLIENHISNYDFIQNNAKKVVRILNSLNNSNNNFIDSIYDIGKWVYEKTYLAFKKIIPKIANKYPVIKIEEKEYYISNLSSPFENHNDFYKTIILTLKNTNNGDKFLCCRNQNNNKLFGDSSSQLKLLSGDFIPSPNIKSAICKVKDSNTTFTFFKYHEVIPFNSFLLEFDQIIFLRSLLLYLEYLRSNNLHNSNDQMKKEDSVLNSLSLISEYIYFNDETIKEDKLAQDLYKLIYN